MSKNSSHKMQNSVDELIYGAASENTRVKESFQFIIEALNKKLAPLSNLSILDVGCARGEFLDVLNKLSPKFISFVGVDISKAMILKNIEENLNPNINYSVVNNFSKKLGSFDVVSALGLMGYMDDPTELVNYFSMNLKENGTGIIYGFLNEFDADVLSVIRYGEFEQKKNLHSIQSVLKILRKFNFKDIEILEFNNSIKIDRDEINLSRMWNIKTDEGSYYRNSCGQIFKLFLLSFRKS